MNNQYNLSENQFQQVEKKIITEQDVEKFKDTKILQNYWSSYNHQQNLLIQENIRDNRIIIQKVRRAAMKSTTDLVIYEIWKQSIQRLARLNQPYLTTRQFIKCSFELRSYLLDSFRNKQRIDYGTRDEFQFFLFQLFRLGINTEMIYAEQNSILQVYQFCKKSEDNFLFQPAGSHRIWGLDDYQFLPFVFGVMELIRN